MTVGPVGLAVRISRVVVLASLATAALAPEPVERASLPILLVGILLGLPHGAVDHLVPFRTGRLRAGRGAMLAVLVTYLAVAALAWAGLTLAGPVVLPLLLVVSVLHFGYGDLAAEAGSTGYRGPGWSLTEAVARGGWVVAGPLLAWPVATGATLAGVGGGLVLPGMRVRVAVAVVVAGCSFAVVRRAARRADPSPVLDVVLLAALFLLVPPLAAFGVYFGGWHGLRHTARLVATDPADVRTPVGRPDRSSALVRFARQAALPTAGALVAVGALVLLAQGHQSATGTVFAVLLALTVPHLVAVALLDRAPAAPGRLVAAPVPSAVP